MHDYSFGFSYCVNYQISQLSCKLHIYWGSPRYREDYFEKITTVVLLVICRTNKRCVDRVTSEPKLWNAMIRTNAGVATIIDEKRKKKYNEETGRGKL